MGVFPANLSCGDR